MDIFSASLHKSLAWFRNSGVMIPASGLWGVAERVVLGEGNEALDKTLSEFPAWSRVGGNYILEQRRADCNFECAYLFLLCSEVFDDQSLREIGVNLLDFLYFRSGLLNRGKAKYPAGSWNWSHICRDSRVWFDDESWCLFLALQIASRYPDLDLRYEMKHHARILSESMAEAAVAALPENLQYDGHTWWSDPAGAWLGNLALPHWGALTVMALSRSLAEWKNPTAEKFIERYLAYLNSTAMELNSSETSYALLGVSAVNHYLGIESARALQARLVEKLTQKISRSGNLPAEHYEAPCGEHLVDTIYTVNWAALALQTAEAPAADKLLKMLVEIQDTTPSPLFAGCWRGMYDLAKQEWGGGNAYEGGAGSVYTGWTNAPIAWCMALHILGKTLWNF